MPARAVVELQAKDLPGLTSLLRLCRLPADDCTELMPEFIGLLDRVKYPYNINLLTQEKALEMLDNEEQKNKWVDRILAERGKLAGRLEKLESVLRVYPSDANFLLVQVTDPDALYDHLAGDGLIVRNRSKMTGCSGCLRITVGTQEENRSLLKLMKSFEDEKGAVH